MRVSIGHVLFSYIYLANETSWDSVFCVGGTEIDYSRMHNPNYKIGDHNPKGSNYGHGINGWAPGQGIHTGIHVFGQTTIATGAAWGTSYAAPIAASIMATFLGVETFEAFPTAQDLYRMAEANFLPNTVSNVPQGTTAFMTTGINHPDREEGRPFAAPAGYKWRSEKLEE